MMRPKRGNNRYRTKNSRDQNYRGSEYRRPEYRHYEQLSEKDVGITEYLGTLDGFSGVIKARFSDFQLNEIDLHGKIAKLTNTEAPKDFALKMVKFNYADVVESPNKNIPQETWDKIKGIIHNPNCEPVLLDIDHIDKEARTEIHNCIKSHFGQKVIASTIQIDGTRKIEFRKFDKEIKDTRVQWPTDKGEYVYFIVYKERMDTLEATLKISSTLNVPAAKFTHAGTKDRRSISSQWFCAKKIEPWKLINKTRNIFNIKIGNIEFRDDPLMLGQLLGNKFRIALRNVVGSDDTINLAMENLKENGFVNYYGLQRFGNDKDVPTFQIGISLLQGKWKEAIDQILKPKISDDANSFQGDVVKAKNVYLETGDPEKAFNALNKNKSIAVEAKLLEGLKGSGKNDYVNALEKVPRTMRLLYLHSFQSLIWNKMVSKRLQLYGMKPVVGDLVLLSSNLSLTEEVTDESSVKEKETKSERNEIEKETEAESNEKDEETKSETEGKFRKKVKVLTEEDLHDYSIYDIVLPLPGYDVIYPENMRDYYKDSIEECGLDLEMKKQKVRTYTLSGDYRKILGKVENFTWSVVRYDNPTDTLILSDLEELRGNVKLQTNEKGRYKAVIMEFTLPSCSYATMVLRQIMKVDTATNVQSKLNDYHSPDKEKKMAPASSEKYSECSSMQEEEASNSLLTNPEKYEQFKNSIFNIISESISKDDDSDVSAPKKQKLEEQDNKTDTS